MWANYQNTGPGSGPYSAVTDPNNVVRAEWGNLAAVGNSPAQYGFRANDSSGVPLFDSLGLIKALTVLNSSSSQSWTSSTLNGAGGSAGISGVGGEVSLTNFTFSVPRTVSVLLIGTCAAAAWITTGIVPLAAPIYIRVTGQANSASSGVAHSATAGNTTSPTGATPLQVLSLTTAGNPYAANMYWNSTGGTNDRLDLYAVNLFCFQLGS